MSSLTHQQKHKLLEIARKTIEGYVKTEEIYAVQETDPSLSDTKGAFVTIHNKGGLRGCIGNIVTDEPLYLTVRNMAIASCSRDFRFNPVDADELKEIDIEISVLSKPTVIKDTDEIKMGTHGVIVEGDHWQSGVFLPQVATETGWSKEEFLSHLCADKAGLPADAWKNPKTIIKIFSAEVFSEKDAGQT